MAGIEGMEGTGKISAEGVSQIVENYRDDAMIDSVKADLKDQLGTKLQPLFDLDEGEVKVLNGMPRESIDTLFHICTRAASSGGKIEYKRYPCDDYGPKMEITYTETIVHKLEGGGPPTVVANVQIICNK